MIAGLRYFWLSYIARSFLRSGRRASFAVICVVVGVAGVVALQTASITVQRALTSNVRAANGGDISLTTDDVPLSQADLGIFRTLERQGQITAWTAMATVHATAAGSNGRLVPFDVDLVSVPPYPLGGELSFVKPSNGTVSGLLAHPHDVLVSSVLAGELGVTPGSRLAINGIGGSGLHAIVRGVLSETSLSHSAAMTVRMVEAPALTSAALHYTAVFVNVPAHPASVASYLSSRFPSDNVQTVAQALQSTQQEVHDFRQFLLLVGLLALLIAGIGILNAMQSILTRRRLEIAMLKTMGYREWTLHILFGGEAVLIGLIGGILGTALGITGSEFITVALAGAIGIRVVFIYDSATIMAGIALAVGATLAFSVVPIVQAASQRPLEVLREGTPPARGTWPRAVVLIALLCALFSILAVVVLGDTVLAIEFVLGTALACAVVGGCFSAIVGWIGRLGPTQVRVSTVLAFVALVAVTVAAVLRTPSISPILVLITLLYGLTIVLPRRLVLPLLIGARGLSRRRARSSLILVAFMVGVLAMTVTLTVAIALQSQVSTILAADRAQNLVAIAGGNTSSRIVRASRGLAGVHSRDVMTTVDVAPTRIDGRAPGDFINTSAPGSRDDPYDQRLYALNGVTGWPLARGIVPPRVQIVVGRGLTARDAGTTNVLLRDNLLGYPYYLSVGSTITVRETGKGTVRTVQVVGFYREPGRRERLGGFSSPPIYGDRSLVHALGGADVQTVVTFSVDQKSLATDAALLQRRLPGVLVVDVGDLTAIVDTILNELLRLLAVLTALVLGAGVAVVANGVALAMLERRREIALFKAVGFGTAGVQSFVAAENALIGAVAGAASVLLTALALGLLSHFAFRVSIGFDPPLAVFVLVIAAVLAVITAYLSARAPIRVRPVEALRNE